MKKHFAVAGIIVLVFLSFKTPAFATMPAEEHEYVRFDEFLLTVEQNLSSATADQIRNKYRDKPYIDFRGSEDSASDFNIKQFVGKFSEKGLIASLQRDGVPTRIDLNELLKRPGLYEQVRNQHLDKVESSSLLKLKQEFDNLKCEKYFPKTTGQGSFGRNAECETLLKRINRAALEEFYPAECPKIPKREFISVSHSFFYEFLALLAPFIERKETEKVKQFLIALNNKKVVYGYRIRYKGNTGCYVVDYSLEMDSDPSVPGIYLVVNKKPIADGVCKEKQKASKTVSFRILIK